MILPAPQRLPGFSLHLTKRTALASVVSNHQATSSKLLAVSLIYALCLQCVLLPRAAMARLSPNAKITISHRQLAENEAANDVTSEVTNNGASSNEAGVMPADGEALSATITDAVVSKHKPTLNSGRIEGTLRVLLGESFTISGNNQITSDLYLPGTPTIQLSGAARYAGTINDGGLTTPANYIVNLSGDVDLPGRVHTQVDPVQLPADFPTSVPAPSGTRAVSIHSQSEIAGIGNWQTVRDLSVSRSGLTVNVPPGNYGTFTVNGNSRLNFTGGTYNFANTFNLDGSASIQATGFVVINVAKSLTVTSGALVAGSYTSPGDVRLNVLGTSVNVNGSSQICGLLRGDNATVTVSGTAQVRGQVIADSLILNGGKVIGSVWPAHSGSSITTFGPRRFDRTTGPPNQYLEQFSLPANATSPYTLHIRNGALDGTNRVSSATVKLNGVVILSPSDLNQNVAGVDRTVTLVSANTLEVSLASVPGSYLIIDIDGIFPPGDTTPPIVAITSPANNSTTTDSQIAVSVTASDPGPGASGVAHVYVNGREATYNPGNNTWRLSDLSLNIGPNSIVAKAADQAGNEATASINVTRETPNQPPVVDAGVDQNIALPQTATLHGSASDDGLPEGSTLVTSWSMIAGPGSVNFDDSNSLITISSFSSAGTYVLRLTSDDGLLSSSDDLTITVQPENQPPTVTAGPDQTIALPHVATLNGSATDDQLPQDSSLTVAWNQVSGPGTVTFAEAYLTNTTATFSEPGTYVLRLTASDSELTSASELTITVQPENQAPTVSAGPDQIVALPAQALLNGSAGDDGWPAGSSLTETWTIVSGPGAVGILNPNTTVTVATFSVPGTYVLRLTASDGDLSTSDDITLTIEPANQPPTVNAGANQTIALPHTAALNGIVTDDGLPTGSTIGILWSQVSGPATIVFQNPLLSETVATFSAPGIYLLRLTATDGRLTASNEVTITVHPENHGPTVNAGPDQIIFLPAAAQLNGVSADDGWPFGSTLTLFWTALSGPGSVTFANPNAPATAASFSAPGTYLLRLTTSDSEIEASDDLIITVRPPNQAPSVSAGIAQTITLPAAANLNGTITDDGLPMGSSVSANWSRLSGPGEVTFGDATNPATTAQFSAAGEYVLRLIASDGTLSSSANVAITVIPENHAPTVNAGVDQAITLPCGVSLNGSAADDGLPSGIPLNILWAKVSGPGNVAFADAGGAQTTATFSAPGKYVLRLTANDSRLQSSDDLTVTVNLVEVGAAQYFAPAPYLSFADSPLSGRNPSYFYLENFEDHLLNTPGVTASAGGVTSVIFGSSVHDSIDADDGVIDGSGLNGDSYFNGNGAAGIRFNFNATALGALPTHAGLVWTDGAGQVYFEAFNRNGLSMGLQGPFNFPDNVNNGTTAEDRFIGAYNKDGISAIRVLNTVGGIEVDHLQYGFSVGNSSPIVNAGNDQSIALPGTTLTLSGVVSDDSLPACNVLALSWSVVSGPGSVSFANAQAAQTTLTLTTIGQYVLRLTASDSQYTVSDDVVINLLPPNQAPVVSAGNDQTITLPANAVTLHGTATDDGQPPGSTLAVSWSVLSGPALVTFASANALNTTASFSEAGTYVLRLAASDSQSIGTDDLVVVVNSDPSSNQPPAATAGPDQTIALHGNLVVNPSDEQLLVDGEIPGWTEVQGPTWTQATIQNGDKFPAAQRGNSYFFANEAAQAELRQDVDVSAFSQTIAAGTQQFELQVYLRSAPEALPDAARVIVEYRNAANSAVIAALDSGPISSTTVWHLTEDIRSAPVGTGWVRVRLIATRNSGTTNDAFFDSISLRPVGSVAIKLAGVVTDDGLPTGSSIFASWTKLSGPGDVSFADASAANTSASFNTAGNYVLRLTASDGQLGADDYVNVTINPPNQAPTVSAGTNQTITIPATANLNGTAIDDGFPVGSSLSTAWSRLTGPGEVTFANANSPTTAASFSAPGIYVLRLTADDGEVATTNEVTISVATAAGNQPPVVNAGPDQTVLLSSGAELEGSAGDDGLPAGNLTTNWTKISGPGAVTFVNSNVTITGALFSVTGIYVLRLTAGDGSLSASDEITITVIDNVAPPTVNITSPTDASSITEPSNVIGSVSDGAWVLEYSLDNDDNANSRVWTIFASGNGPRSNAELGTLDPTMMLNGLFDIRLSSTDSYGQTSRVSIAVIVERNFKVGNFTVSFSDLNIPVAGVPMEVTRTYDSRDKRVGAFGFGWTLGLHNIRLEKSGRLGFRWYETVSPELIPNYCLEATGSHLVTVTFPGGKVFKFQAAVTPHCQRFAPVTSGTLTFAPLPGTHGTLEVVGPADFQVEGSIPGPVNLIGFGGGVDIFNSTLFKFTAEDGSAFVIDQRAGLQSIKDTNNNTVTVSAGGIVHSNGKNITFNRDSLDRITAVIDPAGNAQTYSYNAAGDLVSYTDNENNTSTYTYDTTHRLLTIHDPRGIQPIRNDYDAEGRLISHTDGFGKVITYLHEIPGRVETITDRLGHQTQLEYDERGNVLSKTDARGGVTTFSYDGNDNVLTETNALGKTTTYTYDANDRRTSVTDPLGNVTQFTYNALGKVLTTTDPLNHVTTNTYNAAGNLLTTKDPLNNTISFGYSVFDGQRISLTDSLTNITSYTYTGGYLTKETGPPGHVTTFTYDANGNRTSQTVNRTNALGQLEAITTSYEYDKLNRLRKTTFPDGTLTQVEYNSIGQQSATIDQFGRRTEFTYDDMGRLTRTGYPDGAHDETTYDAEGHRLTSKDRAGHVTLYTYDELGRLTKTAFADGTFMQTSFDAVGQALTTTDARGNVTHYFYDDAGRRTKVRNALNQETSFTYDAGSNQLSMTDALGHTTSYEYDLDNRRTKTTYADSTFASVGYDALGRTVSRIDQAGKTTQFTYNARGRLTKVKDALNQETTYAYDELGQQVSQTDANNHTTHFEYDQLGRRVKRLLPAGQFETYSYDGAGNLQSRTDFNGKITTFTYDLMGRLLTKTPDTSLNQPIVRFSYNATGQRSTMNDAAGTTVYSYDARNRLSSKQTPLGTLSYTYNEAGSLSTTRSSNANGVSVDYSYDALNRLETVKDNNLIALNGGVTNYTYDSVGNLQGNSYPNGVASSYAYNSLNRLTAMTVGTTVQSLAGYSYTLGPTGNRTSVIELSGRTVNYSYDDLYRLTGETITNDPHAVNGSASYSYDPVGNRLNRTSSIAPVPSQASTYDANDRLTGDSYDNNGNTISAGGNSYAYDFENHLTALNGDSVTYVYDGDGNRVAKTVGGATTNYLIDTNNPTGYAQVVEELQSGAVVKSFTYGHDLISQRCSPLTANCSLSFYQYDGHGSVRQLTNASGAVTDTYDYDAFGNLISHTGATPNDYLYSGEQFDANLGFYYLRARYVNPSSGRFLSMDSFAGNEADPASLHKYLYANSDPINRMDPGGQFSLAHTVISSSIIGTISGFGLGLLTGGLKGAVNGAVQGAILGALVPLTGAGVGAALLGNAARGVFIVGWGVGLGSAGVSGYSFTTASTGEERFEAGVGLVASIGFMFVGPKVLERVNTRIISGEQANADFLAQRGGVGEPPWNPPDLVTETTLFRTAKYVRVYLEGRNSPAGAWVMEASEIEGLSMSQIQQKFALPFTPSRITTVDVPAGTTVRIGTAGENAFGPGGGMQVEIQRSN